MSKMNHFSFFYFFLDFELIISFSHRFVAIVIIVIIINIIFDDGNIHHTTDTTIIIVIIQFNIFIIECGSWPCYPFVVLLNEKVFFLFGIAPSDFCFNGLYIMVSSLMVIFCTSSFF